MVLIKDLAWQEQDRSTEVSKATAYFCNVGVGTLSVLCRQTGYTNEWIPVHDVETGYRPLDSEKFYLVMGGFDIREHPQLTLEEAIERIRRNSSLI